MALGNGMWVVGTVSAATTIAATLCVVMMWRELRAASTPWRLLALSGLPLTLGGLGFVVRFWVPLPGPYLANERYPLGPYVNAWAVSFGFMWIAFGLLFFAGALRSRHCWRTWLVLAVTWCLAWVPHGIIGIGFAAAGSNAPSIRLYRDAYSAWPGLLRLAIASAILIAHFGLAMIGLAATARALLRERSAALPSN